MNTTMKKLITYSLLACCITACKPKLTPDKPAAGGANFSRFMVVGDSYAAGFADGSLYRSAQQNSFPAMLAAQFSQVSGGNFKQPLVPGESGLPHPKNVLAIAAGCDGIASLMPVPDTRWDTAGNHDNITAQEPFNNIALPGLRVADVLLPDYITTLNFLKPGELPFAARFFHDIHYSPLQQLQYTRDTLNPTFFTMWLGFYDVFLYAQAGGTGSAFPPGAPGFADITPQQLFETNYDTLVQAMVKNGAQGVLINIPDIMDMPYFNTIPLQDNGGNYFKIMDRAVTRNIADGEHLLLEMPLDSLKCAGWGVTTPIPDKWALTNKAPNMEVDNVRNAIAGYNAFIAKEADKYGLALVDINSYLKTLDPGVVFNGVTYTPKFVEGGAYSLDGLHFTQRGYALIANQVINAINKKYGSTLPQIDVNKYQEVLFP